MEEAGELEEGTPCRGRSKKYSAIVRICRSTIVVFMDKRWRDMDRLILILPEHSRN